MRRLILVAAAAATMAIPVTVAVVGSSSPAFASSSLTCKKLAGNVNNNITLSKCSVPKADKNTYKTATAVSLDLAEGGTITWHSSGATTVINAPTLSTGPGTCKKGNTE
ncbi:MAG: hypothetical protein WBG41_14550, partial [Acidimicrobiales bacterium]